MHVRYLSERGNFVDSIGLQRFKVLCFSKKRDFFGIFWFGQETPGKQDRGENCASGAAFRNLLPSRCIGLPLPNFQRLCQPGGLEIEVQLLSRAPGWEDALGRSWDVHSSVHFSSYCARLQPVTTMGNRVGRSDPAGITAEPLAWIIDRVGCCQGHPMRKN